MQVTLLYAAVVLIWGSTWAAIPFQLGVVAVEVSVAWRFALGSLALFAYAAASGRRLGIPLRHYGAVVTQGMLMFSSSYLFTYYAIGYVTSGLVAVIFSLIVFFNAFFAWLLFGSPVEARLIVAALVGAAGVAFLFWPEVSAFELADTSLLGLLLAVAAVVIASLGNMAAITNTNRGLPVMSVNAHGMAWGALTSLAVSAIFGRRIEFLWQAEYVLSLLYLAIFGSAVAFGCYLALIRRIGAARAAYTAVLFPPVALLISTFVEGYRWTVPAAIGTGLIIAGNWLALTRMKGTNQ